MSSAYGDAPAEFADALRAAGGRLPGLPIMDGEWHRMVVEGDRRNEKSGGYRGYLNGVRPAGFIANFRTSYTGSWRAGTPAAALSAAERETIQREIAATTAVRERRATARQATIARRCAVAWQGSSPAPGDHPYLRRKSIPAAGLRLDRRGRLRVPMRDLTGHVCCLQSIAGSGRKLFPRGARLHGLHLLLGELRGDGPLLIVEGFATGATLHAATGAVVAIAFTKTNFVGIARAYGERFPGLRIVFCGDNDHHLPRRDPPSPNVGRGAAEAAARAVGGVAILPDFLPDQGGTDWNDFARLHDAEAVRAAVEAALPRPATPPLQPHYPAPAGTPEDALAALEQEAEGFFRDAERSVAIKREWLAKLAAIEIDHPPKSPGRRAALRMARREMVEAFGRDWRAPGRRLLLPAPAGIGKTALAARLIREAGAVLGNVFDATDKTDNAVAVVAQIPGSAVVRGRSAPDPKTPGKAMCWRPKAAQAVAHAGLPVGQTLCRNAAGQTCVFHDSCGYQRDATRFRSGDVTVFAGSHEYLTRHGPMPRPDVVMIDESAVGALVGHVEFGFDRLLPDAMPGWQVAGLPEAMAFRVVMVKVCDAMRDPAGILVGLRQRGIATAADLAPTIAYLRKVEGQDFTGEIAPDMDDVEIVERLERYQRSEISGVLKMLTALQAEIALPRDHAHGVVFFPDKPVKVDGRTERQARVAVHYRKSEQPQDGL